MRASAPWALPIGAPYGAAKDFIIAITVLCRTASSFCVCASPPHSMLRRLILSIDSEYVKLFSRWKITRERERVRNRKDVKEKKKRMRVVCVYLRRKESRASQRQPEEHINTLRCAQYGGANQIHMFLSTPSLLFYFPLYPPSSRERKNGAITVKNTSKNLWPNTPRAYGKYLRYF